MTTAITLPYQKESWFSPEHYLVLYRENLVLQVVPALESKGRLVTRGLQGFTGNIWKNWMPRFSRRTCAAPAAGANFDWRSGSIFPRGEIFQSRLAKMRFPVFPGPALANWEGLLRHKKYAHKKWRIWFGNNIIIESRLSLIVRVNVVLNRTVVVDSDWRFNNLYGSHLQSQSELYHVSWWYYT